MDEQISNGTLRDIHNIARKKKKKKNIKIKIYLNIFCKKQLS